MESDDEEYLALTTKHPEMNEKTTFQLFRDRVMARPNYLSPLVRSLRITGYHFDIRYDLEPTITFFRALCNVIVLEIDSKEPEEDEGYFLFRYLPVDVFPKLREFRTSTIPFENPGYQDFLDSHPELIRWHHGVDYEDPSLISRDPGLARIRHFSAGSLNYYVLVQLLQTMPNLTHLSIPDLFHDEGPERLEWLLGYFARFGKGIIELSVNSERETFETFEWLLLHVVPSLPALRHFICITEQHTEHQYSPIVPSPICSRKLLEITFPPYLETIEWSIRDSWNERHFSSSFVYSRKYSHPPPVLDPTIVTRQGSSNVKELFSCIRSLRTVTYTEGQSEFIYYRALDSGKILVTPEERYPVDEDDEYDDDDYFWDVGRVSWLLG